MTSAPEQTENKRRRYALWLLLLLPLLLSCFCVYSSTHLALSLAAEEIDQAHMLAQNRANYGRDPFPTRFAPLNPAIIIQATIDGASLQVTPVIDDGGPLPANTPVIIAYITNTPTSLPTAVVAIATSSAPAPATATATPMNTAVPPSPSPTTTPV
ncbi:MAG: hypothetical protein HND44_10555, partial [Chloroflexi bacterium]|nr:hypothetical protein [Chloroflexota bacterium]NOG34997.1 hypothetical protein [Chloroflexota bacterium]